MGTFSWSARPTTEAEFKALMQAIDTALTAKGLKPFQRPLHVGRKLWEAFNWSGSIFPISAWLTSEGLATMSSWPRPTGGTSRHTATC